MKVIIKIIIVFLVVLAVFMSGFALLAALGIISHNQFSEWTYAFYKSWGARAIVALGGAFVIAVAVLVALIRPKSKRDIQAQVLSAYDGSIKISFEAIIEMVKALAQKKEDVAKVRVKPKMLSKGVTVLVVLTLRHNADIKTITTQIKQETYELLTEQCGIKVIEVEVLIDRVIGKL